MLNVNAPVFVPKVPTTFGWYVRDDPVYRSNKKGTTYGAVGDGRKR